MEHPVEQRSVDHCIHVLRPSLSAACVARIDCLLQQRRSRSSSSCSSSSSYMFTSHCLQHHPFNKSPEGWLYSGGGGSSQTPPSSQCRGRIPPGSEFTQHRDLLPGQHPPPADLCRPLSPFLRLNNEAGRGRLSLSSVDTRSPSFEVFCVFHIRQVCQALFVCEIKTRQTFTIK